MPPDRNGNEHDLTDREVRLSARVLIAEYGAAAEAQARERIAQMQRIGNWPGATAWARILEAIRDIRGDGSAPS